MEVYHSVDEVSQWDVPGNCVNATIRVGEWQAVNLFLHPRRIPVKPYVKNHAAVGPYTSLHRVPHRPPKGPFLFLLREGNNECILFFLHDLWMVLKIKGKRK